MKTTTDPVFGLMNYSHSWKGTCDVPNYGRLDIIVQSYPDEAVSDLQRESFRHFMSAPASFMSAASAALSEFVRKTYPGKSQTNTHPDCIIFQQNGIWGFIYPAPNGEDDGLSVRFEDNRVIADTDDALL